MKTLDEVIRRIEIYKNNFDEKGCFDCHYREDDCVDNCFLENVLYHLNKYKEAQDIIFPDYVALKEYWAHEQENPPLSWEELKAMEGKPVWLEVKYQNPDTIYKYWTIVKYFDSHEGEDLVFTGTGFYHRSLLGTNWQAYRKENNGR